MKHHDSALRSRNLTHLVVYNAGSFNDIYKNAGIKSVRDSIWKRARSVAKELGLPLLQINSNIHQVTGYNHLLSHTYLDMFMVYSLQNLWQKYYYGSGADYDSFDLGKNLHADPAHFELLLLNCFSTQSLEIVLSGAECNRTDKVAFIAKNKIAQKYLHCCTSSAENCGVCEKCRRTLLAIDAAGHIDDFANVFPVAQYKAHLEDHYRFLCERRILNNGQYSDYYEKTFTILYPRHKEIFDRYLRESNPEFVYGKIRHLQSWLEAMRKQFYLLEKIVDKKSLKKMILERLEREQVRKIAFYEESAIRKFMTELLQGTSMEIAYVVSDVPVIGGQLTVYKKSEENLPEVDMMVVTDFIASEATCRKLQRFRELGQVVLAQDLLCQRE